MEAGNASHKATKLGSRYLPFLAIIALQFVLVAITPGTKTTTVTEQSAGDTNAAAGSEISAGAVGGQADAGGTSASAAATGGGGTATSQVQQTSGANTASGGAARPAAAAAGQTAAGGPAAQATAQALDNLGRPTAGDKSKCAPGGLVQTTIISHQIPCMPKFTGDNGGATAQGVTADTITIVLAHPHYPTAIQQALQAGGLEATDEQYAEFAGIEAEFFNRHYEFYGRKLKALYFASDCTDAPCFRADAKALNAKFKPFAVFWYTAGIAPEAFMDQLSQLGVVNAGVVPLSDGWYKSHAPYAWDLFPQGFKQADNGADYYCKKMWGQNASRAGDPTMRVKKRKLGIISSESPPALEVANRFKAAVTGGMCGSDADGTTLYTTSTDAATAQNQVPTLVTRMKNDGITTRTVVGGVPGYQEDDKQQYFPENFMNFASDADIVGRLFEGLISPNQMGNVFGLGWLEQAQPLEKQDWYLAIKSVNPTYEPVRIAQGAFNDLMLLANMIQWAGPNLTAKNMEAGARSSPQVGGWVNANPWPGWKCCNGHVNGLRLTGATTYTAKFDAAEKYWSHTAISGEDNQPGAFVCVDPNCKRYESGQWTKGEAGKS